jgi:hypothetical protein
MRQPARKPGPAEAAPAPSLLDAILQEQERKPPPRVIPGYVVGWITALGEDGLIRVEAPSLGDLPLMARSMCPMTVEQVGAQCILSFELGDPRRPLVMGLLQDPVIVLGTQGTTAVIQDAESVRVYATQEIHLHCGKATLRMTRDGRIELRGTTVVSHASGLNRIRGGVVKLN